jgi:hypothetical protein
MGTVHLRSDITLVRLTRADEALRYECLIEGHRVVDKGVEFDWQLQVYSGDELVWSGVASLLSRTGKGGKAKDKTPSKLEPLTQAETTVIEANGAAARRWAVISDDWNPIHLSGLTARLFGFKGQIMHGMWTLGRVTALARARLARPGARLSCEMKLPILAPARLTVKLSDGAFQVLDANGEKPHLVGRIS